MFIWTDLNLTNEKRNIDTHTSPNKRDKFWRNLLVIFRFLNDVGEVFPCCCFPLVRLFAHRSAVYEHPFAMSHSYQTTSFQMVPKISSGLPRTPLGKINPNKANGAPAPQSATKQIQPITLSTTPGNGDRPIVSNTTPYEAPSSVSRGVTCSQPRIEKYLSG